MIEWIGKKETQINRKRKRDGERKRGGKAHIHGTRKERKKG